MTIKIILNNVHPIIAEKLQSISEYGELIDIQSLPNELKLSVIIKEQTHLDIFDNQVIKDYLFCYPSKSEIRYGTEDFFGEYQDKQVMFIRKFFKLLFETEEVRFYQ